MNNRELEGIYFLWNYLIFRFDGGCSEKTDRTWYK